MSSLFEKQDSLNSPIETFLYDSEKTPLPVKPHWHYFAEFLYVIKGTAVVTCDSSSCTVSEGELMILFPSSVHSIYSENGEPVAFIGMKFDTAKFPNTSTYAPSVTAVFRYARANGVQTHFGSTQAEGLRCREIFNDCLKETGQFLYGRDIMLRADIYKLIFGIIRLWAAAGLDMNKCPVNSADIYGIENIAEYIDSRLEEKIRVDEIAKICHMSYSGFAAKFREQYGMSCKEYIERMRIFKSEEYLLFTDHDLTYISRLTGFADCSHFIRTFRKYRGMTPKQFRMKSRKME